MHMHGVYTHAHMRAHTFYIYKIQTDGSFILQCFFSN
jgi:hypothetical protein